jgi:hypothetical protein
MSMTKKDFEGMAEILKVTRTDAEHNAKAGLLSNVELTEVRITLLAVSGRFCAMAKADNPRFDEDKFREAWMK